MAGINRNEDPLIETRSSPHQFKRVKIWSNAFKMTPTLTKMLSGMKIKHISGHSESSILLWNLYCFYRVNCLRLWNIERRSSWRKMFPRQPFATNAIYHYVIQPHHVMLLQAIYGFVRDGMTFDQCVWPCFTLLPAHLILSMSDEGFF